MKKLAILLAMISMNMILPACTTTSPVEEEATPAQNLQCSAENLQAFVGEKLTPELTEKISSRSAASVVRVIRPNQAITMDYNAARVNVHLDKDDVITMITCG